MLYDHVNRLVFTLGAEGKISAWPQRNTQAEQERKTINFRKKQVTFMRICPKNTLIATGNTQDNELTIWNY